MPKKTAITTYKDVDITIELVSGKCHIKEDCEANGEYPNLAAAEKAVRMMNDDTEDGDEKPAPWTNVLVTYGHRDGQFVEAKTRFTVATARSWGKYSYIWVQYTGKRQPWQKKRETVSLDNVYEDSPENRATLAEMEKCDKAADDARAKVYEENRERRSKLTPARKAV